MCRYIFLSNTFAERTMSPKKTLRYKKVECILHLYCRCALSEKFTNYDVSGEYRVFVVATTRSRVERNSSLRIKLQTYK